MSVEFETLGEAEQAFCDEVTSCLSDIAVAELSTKQKLSATVTETETTGDFEPTGYGESRIFTVNTFSREPLQLTPVSVVPSPRVNGRDYLVRKERFFTISPIDYRTKLDDLWAIASLTEEYANTVMDDPPENNLPEILESIEGLFHAVAEEPSLTDLRTAVESKNAPLLTTLFDEDTPVLSQTESELAGLFAGGGVQNRTQVTDSYVVATNSATREVFILGLDDTPTGVFIHAVDGRDYDSSTDVTDEDVRDAMGYDTDLNNYDSAEHWEDINPYESSNGVVRLQGDLSIDRVISFHNETDVLVSHYLASELRECIESQAEDEEFKSEFFDAVEVYFCRLFDYIEVEITEKLYELLVEYEETIETSQGPVFSDIADPDTIGLFSPEILPDVNSAVGRTGGFREKSLVEIAVAGKLKSFTQSAFLAKHGWRDSVETNREIRSQCDMLDDIYERNCGRLNLPIDNHLLIFDNAWVYPLSESGRAPVSVVVPNESEVTVFHGEHETRTITVPSGIYKIDLLPRGMRVNSGDTPEW